MPTIEKLSHRRARTKIVGSTCLVLGNIEAISIDKELEELDIIERGIAVNRPIFFSNQRGGNEGKWMFGEMGKIHVLTEKDGETEIRTEIA